MPVDGLPPAVEGALINLLSNGHVSSWKINGHGSTATLVLNFIEKEQGVMADQPFSLHYRKKPPSQIRRDQTRSDMLNTNKQKSKDIKSNDENCVKEVEVNDNGETERKETELSMEIADDSLQKKGDKTVQEQKAVTRDTQVHSSSQHTVSQKSVSVTQTTNSLTEKSCSQTKQESYTDTIYEGEAEDRLRERNFEPEEIRTQAHKFSMRMMKLHVDKTRNCKFEKIRVDNSTGKDELIAETDDFFLICQVNDTTKKRFLIKNSPMY